MRTGKLWPSAVGAALAVLGCMRPVNIGDELGIGGIFSDGGRSANNSSSGGLPSTDGSGGGQAQSSCVGPGTFDDRAGPLFNLTYSRDGSLVAAAASHGTNHVRVFRVNDNSLLWEVNAHPNGAYGVAFSPDGSLLASAGAVANDNPQHESTVKLWRVSDGALIMDVPVPPSTLTSGVEFSHDGRLLATAGSSVDVWRVSDFTRVFSIPDYAYSAHFSADDSLLATDGASLARVWRVADGSLVSTMSGHTYYVQDAEFSPDGTQLATAAEDNTTRIWDVATGKQLQVLQESTGLRYINDVLWYDSNRLITNDWQGRLHTWVRGSGGKFQRECEQWVGPSQALALSPDRSELRVGGMNSPPEMIGSEYQSGMWIFRVMFP